MHKQDLENSTLIHNKHFECACEYTIEFDLNIEHRGTAVSILGLTLKHLTWSFLRRDLMVTEYNRGITRVGRNASTQEIEDKNHQNQVPVLSESEVCHIFTCAEEIY